MTLTSLHLLLSYEIPGLLSPFFCRYPAIFLEYFFRNKCSYSGCTFVHVECEFVNGPLRNNYLFVSDLVKGPVAVGVR